jgi:hypothetical protein
MVRNQKNSQSSTSQNLHEGIWKQYSALQTCRKGFGNDIAPCNLHEGIWKRNGVLQTCKKRFGIEMASCKADSPYIFLK